MVARRNCRARCKYCVGVPAGWRTTTTAAFERAAAKAKEEKERIAPEAREAERARRRGIQSQAGQAARDQKFERYDVRREVLLQTLLLADFPYD